MQVRDVLIKPTGKKKTLMLVRRYCAVMVLIAFFVVYNTVINKHLGVSVNIAGFLLLSIYMAYSSLSLRLRKLEEVNEEKNCGR